MCTRTCKQVKQSVAILQMLLADFFMTSTIHATMNSKNDFNQAGHESFFSPCVRHISGSWNIYYEKFNTPHRGGGGV